MFYEKSNMTITTATILNAFIQDTGIKVSLSLDVESWREGGGRGAMQQQQLKPEPQSPPSSTSLSQTETQQNGPQTSGGSINEAPVTTVPPRPGSNHGPPQGPTMPMGPHMGMPPQYRGMMPPYVSFSFLLLI